MKSRIIVRHESLQKLHEVTVEGDEWSFEKVKLIDSIVKRGD